MIRDSFSAAAQLVLVDKV